MHRFSQRTKLGACFCACIVLVLVNITMYTFFASQDIQQDHWNNIAEAMKSTNINCTCMFKGKAYNFCYTSAENNLKGSRFSCKYADHLAKLDLLSPNRGRLAMTDGKKKAPLVFVLPLWDHYAFEGARLIRNINTLWPGQKTIVYDLGLGVYSAPFEDACNVEYRMFLFARFPYYFSNIVAQRFKPIIISEVMREGYSVVYLDPMVIFTSNQFMQVHGVPQVKLPDDESYPLLSSDENEYYEPDESSFTLFSLSGYGIFAASGPHVYKYIPVNMKKLHYSRAPMYATGVVYVSHTPKSFEILKWYVLCALEENCMDSDEVNHICMCIPDESVLNLLLFNAYSRTGSYTRRDLNFFEPLLELTDPLQPMDLSCRY